MRLELQCGTGLLLITLLALAGCAAGTVTEAPETDDGGAGGGGDVGAGGGTSIGGFGTGGEGLGPTECAAGTDLVYLAGLDGQLIQFDPAKVGFASIGEMHCPGGGSPFSMIVARDGYARVLFDDGNVFAVDINDASCSATSFAPNQIGFEKFGMGALAASPESEERVFVSDFSGLGIAELDLGTLHLEFVGAYDALYSAAELTGTADGRLYGFFPNGGAPVVAEIDPTKGAILSLAPQPIEVGNAWAFAFWGGDFYLFTSPDDGFSRIHRYRPSEGTTTFVSDVPSVVIGAGVSTCAPLEPPQ